jgi:hypothetical protein
MLLSSILRILDQYPAQPKVVEKAKVEKSEIKAPPEAKETSGLQKIEMEIAAAAELLKSPLIPHPTGTLSAGQNLEELNRAVTKFEKSEEVRVVDVFE